MHCKMCIHSMGALVLLRSLRGILWLPPGGGKPSSNLNHVSASLAWPCHIWIDLPPTVLARRFVGQLPGFALGIP